MKTGPAQTNKIPICAILAAAVFVLFYFGALPVSAATASGTIESAVYDAGTGVSWGAMSWSASTSASATITMKVRTGTTTDLAHAPDWDSCAAVTSGADISGNACVSDNDRFIQYYALFEAEYAGTSTYASPELYEVKIEFAATGKLVSSPYDTLADDTVLSAVRWTEDRPAGTDVLVQLRTSADGADWTGWLGPDGTAYSHFTDPGGGESLPAVFTDGAGERFFQYRVILDSGGTDLPALSSIELDFTAAIPVITGAAPSYAFSNASGTIAVILSGANFAAGASVSVLSGGSAFPVADRSVTANAVSFNLDTSRLFGGPAAITVTNPNGAAEIWTGFYVHEYRGIYVSATRELPNLYFNDLSWSAATTATATVALKIRTSNNSGMSGAADWADCPAAEPGADISSSPCVTDGERYVQYRADFTAVYGTSTGYFTPELSAVILNYARYADSGELISSPYDSGSGFNALRSLSWNADAPAGTAALFQLRTAPDAGGVPGDWTEWLGPLGPGSFYRNADGRNVLPLEHTDGTGDRYFQYRVRFESDGELTPVLGEITVEYGEKKYSEIIIHDNVILKDGVIFR